MKIKTINGKGPNWASLDDCVNVLFHIDEEYKGYISLIKDIKVKVNRVMPVDYGRNNIPLFADGYKCLIFLPDHEHWCVSAIYKPNHEIVEWYFDMIQSSSLDEEGNPTFVDLYLDVAVSPDMQPVVLDEDELLAALEAGVIEKQDYDMAHAVCDYIVEKIVPDKGFMVDFLGKYLNM